MQSFLFKAKGKIQELAHIRNWFGRASRLITETVNYDACAAGGKGHLRSQVPAPLSPKAPTRVVPLIFQKPRLSVVRSQNSMMELQVFVVAVRNKFSGQLLVMAPGFERSAATHSVARRALPFTASLKANLSFLLPGLLLAPFPFCFVYSTAPTCLTKLQALAEMPSLMVQSLS